MTDSRFPSGYASGHPAGYGPYDDAHAWDYEPAYDLAEGASSSERWQARRPIGDGRVRHQVYVDGRLVDSWVETSLSGPWEADARRMDREREHVCRAPLPPPPPRHEAILEWLAQVVGDAHLAALTTDPHPEPRPPTLTGADAASVHEAVCGHLDRVAEAHFGSEVGRILTDALTTLWERAPEATLTRSPISPPAGCAGSWATPTAYSAPARSPRPRWLASCGSSRPSPARARPPAARSAESGSAARAGSRPTAPS